MPLHPFFIFLLCIITRSVLSQSTIDTITIRNQKNLQFNYQGQSLKPIQLFHLLETNQAAIKETPRAKFHFYTSRGMAIAGGLMVGWPIGNLIDGSRPRWDIAAMGLGLAVLSIPFENAYSRHVKRAITIFNQTANRTSWIYPSIQYNVRLNKVGIKLLF